MKLKSIWSTITGGASSVAPILFSCCKGGACAGVCLTPVASLFGVSAATIAASPVVLILEPVLIALSAVSFTVSYYSLYKLPKRNCGTQNACDCPPEAGNRRSMGIQKWIFWLGLIVSIGFLSYFEYSKYQAANSECSSSGCAPAECSTDEEKTSTVTCDSSSFCCSEPGASDSSIVCKLTSAELKARRETVIASLKKQIIEKQELPNGYAYKFEGSDAMIDELAEFVKSERTCCSFFSFDLSFSSNTTWLKLTGPKGTKEMIALELGL